MTNQLEAELRAIQQTINETKKQRNQATDPHYTRYLNKKLDQLYYEEKTILHKIGIHGELLWNNSPGNTTHKNATYAKNA